MSLNWSDYQNYLVIGEFTMINLIVLPEARHFWRVPD
jgi:hypothetical protein